MSFLNVYEIKKFLENKEKKRIQVFECVYNSCLKKIENSVLKNEKFTLFQVPEFMLGYPTYNLGHCIQYIIFILKKNGFDVEYFYPNVLKIEWLKEDVFTSILHNEVAENGKLIGYEGIYSNTEIMVPEKKKKTLELKPSSEEIQFNFLKEKKEISDIDKKFKVIDTFVPKTNIFKNFKKD